MSNRLDLEVTEGRAPKLCARMATRDLSWLDELAEKVGTRRSDVLRRLVALGRDHEEELTRAS